MMGQLIFFCLGSEHRKSLTTFPMEMHLLHYKATRTNITEAMKEGKFDSLAILAIFFSVCSSICFGMFYVLFMFQVQLSSLVSVPRMDTLIDSLVNITQPGTESRVRGYRDTRVENKTYIS